MPYQQLVQQLQFIRDVLQRMDDNNYTQKSNMLGDVSIGQHVRHIAELAHCLVAGYSDGLVNYETRPRDTRIETERMAAIQMIQQLQADLSRPDKLLQLEDNHDRVGTTYFREVVYNTEHAIHHMALIRVALRELKLDIVPKEFGMAYATLHYQQKVCAQ